MNRLPVAILCGGNGTRANLPINKCFVAVEGKPFILHIMEHFEEQGFTTFVLCRGTGGTLKALRDASGQLGEKFLVAYGDTLLRLDLRHFVSEWQRSRRSAIVAEYDGVDAGVSGYATWMLDLVDSDDLAAMRNEAISRYMVHQYKAPEKWIEVGTPEALAEARSWFQR